MTLWLNHTIDERIAMLQRAEEKFRINQVAIEKDWWVNCGAQRSFQMFMCRSTHL